MFYDEGCNGDGASESRVPRKSQEITQKPKFDTLEEAYIHELLPLAVEVGLAPFDFWYGDLYLLDTYIIAYNRHIENTTKLNGFYTYLAVGTLIDEMFSKGSTLGYFERIELMEKTAKTQKETKEENIQKRNFWSTLKRLQNQRVIKMNVLMG